MSYKTVVCQDECKDDVSKHAKLYQTISEALSEFAVFHANSKKQTLNRDVDPLENTDMFEQVQGILGNTVEYWKQFGFMDRFIDMDKVIKVVCKQARALPVVDDADDDDANAYEDFDDK